jgi:hypothetical protein
MRNLLRRRTIRPKTRLLLTIGAIAIGLAVAGVFGARSVRSFHQLQYIRQQGLDRGAASPDAIRPWMTIRFVAVAYAVPEDYLYSMLGIPFNRRNANRALGELNRDYGASPSTSGGELPIVDNTRAAIEAYRANPVATGLHDVRPWMSIRYIANSSGVPEEYIFTQIGLPKDGNENKPLDFLSEEQHYKGGPRALADAVQSALAAHQGQP